MPFHELCRQNVNARRSSNMQISMRLYCARSIDAFVLRLPIRLNTVLRPYHRVTVSRDLISSPVGCERLARLKIPVFVSGLAVT